MDDRIRSDRLGARGTAGSGPGDGCRMLTFLLNMPTTHNDALFDALRSGGAEVRAVYHTNAAATGRTWEPARPRESSPLLNVGLGSPAGSDVILSGGWSKPVEISRRLIAPIGSRSTHWWGEGFRPGSQLIDYARKAWFRSPGLDGILAVGSTAVDCYSSLAGDRVPVHVFPYSTSRGLGVRPSRSAEPTIGFVGRLLSYKGPDLVVRAMRFLPTGTVLEVVGDGPMRADLESAARGAGVRVRFFGALEPDRVDDLRRRWWAQVIPNRGFEGWGMAVNEALASSVPVVSTDLVTAARDLVRTGLNGVILEPNDAENPEALAAAISTVLDPTTQATMSSGAGKVGAAFSSAAAARWLLELITDFPCSARSFVEDAWAVVDSSAERDP